MTWDKKYNLLSRTPKNANIKKSDTNYVEIKDVHLSRYHKVKNQATNWENIFVILLSDKGLLYEI